MNCNEKLKVEDINDNFLEKIKTFVNDVLIPSEMIVETEDTIPESIIEKMKELKLFGLTIPKKYGGLELSPCSEMEVLFEFGKTSPAFEAYFGTNIGIGSLAILLNGSETQKDKYLPAIAKGDIISSFALTEENAGSDAHSIQCLAEKKIMVGY